MNRNTSLTGLLAIAALSMQCSADDTSDGAVVNAGGVKNTGGASASGSGGSAVPANGGSVNAGSGGVANGVGGSVGGSPSGGSPSGGTSPGGGSAGIPSTGGSAGMAGGGGLAGAGGGAGVAGSGGATPVPTCTGMLLCDDFESYTPGASPSGQWKMSKQGTAATAVVDSMQKYSGAKAVHFSGKVTSNASVHMTADGAPVFPVSGNTLFVRFMMYVQTYPGSTGEEMHTRLLWVGPKDTALNTSGAGYNSNAGRVYVLATYNGIATERLSDGYYRDTTHHIEEDNVGKWICWEYEVDNAGGPPAGVNGAALTHIWMDSTELKLTVRGGESQTWGAIPFELVNFSLFAYQTSTEVANFWIDDVAVSKTRIGCPKN